MATLLLLLAAITGILSIPSSAVAIWVALRRDRVDVRTARQKELDDAEAKGYGLGKRDAELAAVQAQLKELRQERP